MGAKKSSTLNRITGKLWPCPVPIDTSFPATSITLPTAGEFARQYNRRKRRSGAFWEGCYQLTMVEGGPYLERCLVYVDLNMVSCGVVKHPSQWDWSGYCELMGHKKRNRLLKLTKLLELLGGVEISEFRRHYEKLVMERIEKDWMKREGQWTESLAVGGQRVCRAGCNR